MEIYQIKKLHNCLGPCLKDMLTLICPSFARKETTRLSRNMNPLLESWKEYDNDELARLIKYQFDHLESRDGNPIEDSYDEVLNSIGDQIVEAVLSWVKLKSFRPIVKVELKLLQHTLYLQHYFNDRSAQYKFPFNCAFLKK